MNKPNRKPLQPFSDRKVADNSLKAADPVRRPFPQVVKKDWAAPTPEQTHPLLAAIAQFVTSAPAFEPYEKMVANGQFMDAINRVVETGPLFERSIRQQALWEGANKASDLGLLDWGVVTEQNRAEVEKGKPHLLKNLYGENFPRLTYPEVQRQAQFFLHLAFKCYREGENLLGDLHATYADRLFIQADVLRKGK